MCAILWFIMMVLLIVYLITLGIIQVIEYKREPFEIDDELIKEIIENGRKEHEKMKKEN